MEKLYILEAGRRRPAAQVSCHLCGTSFLCQERFIRKGFGKYCSKECGHRAQRNQVEFSCSWCGEHKTIPASKLANSKSGLRFCGRLCKEQAQKLDGGLKEIQPEHYGKTNSDHAYRQKAFAAHTHGCNRCGYNKITGVLQVHHIDRDHSNSATNNLEILCPTCHMEDHFLAKDGFFSSMKD